jgi:hypothetical protein
MVVKGLHLPESFVQFWQAIREGTLREAWVAKDRVDAYGHPWGAEVEIYTDERTMEEATDSWAQTVQSWSDAEIQEGVEANQHEPGFVPYVVDFTKVLCIGNTPSGEDLCLDFRTDALEPSVIYWDDVFWRRLAPNFDSFFALLQSGYEVDL